MEQREYTFLEHLQELRARLIKSVFIVGLFSLLLFNFTDDIIFFLARPIGRLIFISPQEAFTARVKVAFFSGLLLSLPFIFYQAWKFISTGLKPKEYRYLLIFGPLSIVFFLAGVSFSYFLIIPVGINFLLSFGSDFLFPMVTINAYITFIFTLSLGLGLVFQLPLATVFLTKINLITPAWLVSRRKQAIVLIFIAAALFTPPDVVTQFFMAFPLVFLYELGVIFSRITYRQAQRG